MAANFLFFVIQFSREGGVQISFLSYFFGSLTQGLRLPFRAVVVIFLGPMLLRHDLDFPGNPEKGGAQKQPQPSRANSQARIAIPIALYGSQIGPPARNGKKMAKPPGKGEKGRKMGKLAQKWVKNGNFPIFSAIFSLFFRWGENPFFAHFFPFRYRAIRIARQEKRTQTQSFGSGHLPVGWGYST